MSFYQSDNGPDGSNERTEIFVGVVFSVYPCMFPTTALLGIVSSPFKRAQLGLFHGKTKQYGNNVPFSKKKTRRTWLPNVQNKRLESAALGRHLSVKVTTRALRTINKVC